MDARTQKLAEMDTRNLRDEYKGMTNEQVFARLAEKRSALEVAIENVEHDFNAGTIVRSANNFNAARVHIIGRRKYNRRGAMVRIILMRRECILSGGESITGGVRCARTSI